MDSANTAETQLINDVEMLRRQHSNTQDLYREVCAVMFFRYGMTPTANRLYQLVRKGSMSAPAEALNRFWAQLRERSRVTIDGPDLPDSLKNGAGELLSALWKQAQEAAAASYATQREEINLQLTEARRNEADAANVSTTLEAELQTSHKALAEARAEAAEWRAQAAAAEALAGRLQKRIDDGRRELNEQHAWFKTVEREHAAEKAALAAAQQQAERELERERAATARLQQGWDDERSAANAAAERHRAELREMMAQFAAQLGGRGKE
ncbi:plasmid replication DNA-binding protein KfrA [Pseudoduganella lurida]|uniref:Plasmid replication DNA-binding protein KfrA n=1 Tax=Pseudoduganella lurida TaxID=1036180 RepID=A0A562RJ38_9BURK|nr:DNA-binding protein [Pseudoduganella lurida]TWI69087.1 plasmid replication DNA-binding protein KfrA [Pseudoduganella lurida]